MPSLIEQFQSTRNHPFLWHYPMNVKHLLDVNAYLLFLSNDVTCMSGFLSLVVIDDPNLRVFRCLNQECLKETCRVCGESNHIPLRCDEVEKKDELDMRTFIENRVSEAMIRVCYKCKQRFYKLEGKENNKFFAKKNERNFVFQIN
jgi:hypothetical protein